MWSGSAWVLQAKAHLAMHISDMGHCMHMGGGGGGGSVQWPARVVSMAMH